MKALLVFGLLLVSMGSAKANDLHEYVFCAGYMSVLAENVEPDNIAQTFMKVAQMNMLAAIKIEPEPSEESQGLFKAAAKQADAELDDYLKDKSPAKETIMRDQAKSCYDLVRPKSSSQT